MGAADGAIKRAIFGGNNARLYGINQAVAESQMRSDKLAAMKAEYERQGRQPSNLRYGYVAGPIDHSVFT